MKDIENLKFELGSEKAKCTDLMRQEKKLERKRQEMEELAFNNEGQAAKYVSVN